MLSLELPKTSKIRPVLSLCKPARSQLCPYNYLYYGVILEICSDTEAEKESAIKPLA